MEAKDGIKFLVGLIFHKESQMDFLDLEEAFRIAEKKSPSAAIKIATRYFYARHGSEVFALGFGKGTRWLSVIRRDEGQAAFEKAREELRLAAKNYRC